MAKPKSAVTKVIDEASRLDLRRQAQIANQTETINRLLVNGSYDDEMAKLHEELADARSKLAEVLG